MFIRSAKHSWTFYPAHPQVLHEMIMSFIVQINETFDFDSIVSKLLLKRAVISPHAWYIYSWIVAAASYNVLRLNANIKRLIIIWPSHYVGENWWLLCDYDWFETPLWILKVDKDLVEILINKSPEIFTFSNEAHEPEHSIEVQLPFVQTVLNVDSFVPILGWLDADWKTLGQILKEVISTYDDIWLIISSDLSHYLPYNVANKVDLETIDAIIKWSAEFIVPERACWWLGIRSYIHMTKLLNVWRFGILYMNSWDTAGDKSRVVWYCSIAS